MAWKIVLFESHQAVFNRYGFTPVGAMWPIPEGQPIDDLGANYLRDWAGKRRPLMVALPGGWFCIDGRAYDHSQGGYHGDGWSVSGQAPNVTVSPSINIVGRYHGWIRDGMITDDCDGRTFPDAKGVPDA